MSPCVWLSLASLCALAFQTAARRPEERPAIELQRLTGGELQPQTVVGSDGVVHLLSFRGEPASGELLYRRARDEEGAQAALRWSEPLLVGSGAVATGRVSGAQLALGRAGRVHVAWAGSPAAQPRAPDGTTPILAARLAGDGRSFEPARCVITERPGIDAGPAIAADERGRVWIAWHAPESRGGGEDDRRLWIARSTDGGSTFERERLASPLVTGACACCRVALACQGERVYALYRAARERNRRGMVLSVSEDGGLTFASRELDQWLTETCPLSTAVLLATPEGMLAAWQRAGSISRAWLDGLEAVRESRVTRTFTVSDGWSLQRPPAGLEHPALARNAAGVLLTVSLADVRWGTESKLDWHLEERDGTFLALAPRPIEPVPCWDLAAAFARPDGSFVILY